MSDTQIFLSFANNNFYEIIYLLLIQETREGHFVEIYFHGGRRMGDGPPQL